MNKINKYEKQGWLFYLEDYILKSTIYVIPNYAMIEREDGVLLLYKVEEGGGGDYYFTGFKCNRVEDINKEVSRIDGIGFN